MLRGTSVHYKNLHSGLKIFENLVNTFDFFINNSNLLIKNESTLVKSHQLRFRND